MTTMSDNPWLSDGQLEELTGYKLAKYQMDWLNRNRIQFYTTANGKPRVPHGSVGGRLEKKQKPDHDERDFTVVRRVS